MPESWIDVPGPAGLLAVHVAGAAGAALLGLGPTDASDEAGSAAGPCLVVCHGLPVEPAAAGRTGRTFPALADRLAAESGWCVVACCLRGAGPSEGDFSLAGWADDLASVIGRVVAGAGGALWLAGFGVGGSVALCVAEGDQRVRGVATLGAPAWFAPWTQDPVAAVAAARRLGVIRTPGFPPDPEAWAAAGRRLVPARAASSMGGRPLLIVHGADDDVVPVADARTLAGSGGPTTELRIVAGAGHRLRADPRAIALLLGWLERQGP